MCVRVCGMSMCVLVCVHRGMYIEVREQDAPITLLPSFIYVVSRDGIQMVRFGNKHFNSLYHPPGPDYLFFSYLNNAQNIYIVHYLVSHLKIEMN